MAIYSVKNILKRLIGKFRIPKGNRCFLLNKGDKPFICSNYKAMGFSNASGYLAICTYLNQCENNKGVDGESLHDGYKICGVNE